MMKINYIKTLKVLKGTFFGSSFGSFIIFFILDFISIIHPSINPETWSISVGAYNSSNVIENPNLLTFYLNGAFCVFFVFATILLLVSIASVFIIKFNKSFIFNHNDCFKPSILWLFFLIVFFITTCCVIFIKPDPIFNNASYYQSHYLNTFYDYELKNNLIYFILSTLGKWMIVFITIQSIILFSFFIFFSYKIIKKKYI